MSDELMAKNRRENTYLSTLILAIVGSFQADFGYSPIFKKYKFLCTMGFFCNWYY